MKIIKGDKVVVIAGKDKGKEKRIQITPKFKHAPVAQCVVLGLKS